MNLVERVHARVVAEGADARGPHRVTELVRQEAPLLDAAAEAAHVAAVLAAIEGLGPLEPMMGDPQVTDILVNGDGAVWVERAGQLVRSDTVLPTREVERLIERIVAPLGLRADRSSPMVDARLPDGSRVHAVVPPLAVDGPCLTIRRFAAQSLPLVAFGPPDVAGLLATAARATANIVVSGGTGSGKTTLLNALAAEIPAGTRIITVEDAAELRLPRDHVVRLESRCDNSEGAGAVTIRELVRNALRMRPDRIIVGECRGGEALDMLQAMNTGHEGSMTTCHANSCDDALRRVETMVLLAGAGLPLAAVREQLVSAIDLVVHVGRVPGEARRRVVAVAEVTCATASTDGRTRLLATHAGTVADPVRPRLVDVLS